MSIIKEKQEALLAQCIEIASGRPRFVYEVSPRGTVEVYTVTDIRYNAPEYRLFYTGKKPTNLDLVHIEEAAKLDLVFDKNHVLLIISQDSSRVKSSQGLRLVDINYVKWFDQHLSAMNVAEERKQRVADEQRVLDGGKHFKCARCGKIAPNYEAKVGEITFRTNGKLGTKTLTFCSHECRIFEQYAHEG